MFEFVLVAIGGGVVGGFIVYLARLLFIKFRAYRHLKSWEKAGRRWRSVVDYSTREIVPETAEEERHRIELARGVVDSYDLRSLSDEVDEGFTHAIDILADESNPNRISDVSEMDEQKERLAGIVKNEEAFHKMFPEIKRPGELDAPVA